MSVVAAWDRCGNIVGLSNSNMSELPRIALARLRAKAQAPRASGAPVGPPAFQGAEHPDANLLAALAENALTEKERNEVLTHLSQCAHCREVAAFIVPPDAVVVSSAREAEARRFHPWRLLRWGAMAAVLGMLAMVVVLHPEHVATESGNSEIHTTTQSGGKHHRCSSGRTYAASTCSAFQSCHRWPGR